MRRIKRLAGHTTGAILSYGAVGFIARMRVDIANRLGRTFLSIPIYGKNYGSAMEALSDNMLVRAGDYISQTTTDYLRQVFGPNFSNKSGLTIGALFILMSVSTGLAYLVYLGHCISKAERKTESAT